MSTTVESGKLLGSGVFLLLSSPGRLGYVMLGVAVVLYSLFLIAGVLGRYRPTSVERRLGALGFVVLSSLILGRGLPLPIVPVLTCFLVVFLQRAR